MSNIRTRNYVWLFIFACSLTALIVTIGLPGDDEPFWPVCADIHPCNPDGTVIESFHAGACADFYAKECTRDLQDRVFLSNQINACQAANAELSAKLDNAARQIKRLQKLKRR